MLAVAVFAASLIQPAPHRHAGEQRVVEDERRLVVEVSRHEDCEPHKTPPATFSAAVTPLPEVGHGPSTGAGERSPAPNLVHHPHR
jgi:hypothetical protein